MPKKITTDSFIDAASTQHDGFYDYSLCKYVNQMTEVTVICPDHGEFLVKPKLHIRKVGTVGCPECGRIRQGKPLDTLADFVGKAKNAHGDKYDYSEVSYVNSFTKVKIGCLLHGVFEKSPGNHINNKQGCPTCAALSSKKSLDDFLEQSKEVWGNRFDYTNTKYVNASQPVEIVCREHGAFTQTPCYHLSGKMGCVPCAKRKHMDSLTTISYEEYLDKVKSIHNDEYEYPEKFDDFLQSKTVLDIICPIHGNFSQRAIDHLHKRGCPRCGDQRTADLKRKPTDVFIKQAIKVHDGKYRYNNVDYSNNRTLVDIECTVHGIFQQAPRPHLRGAGCPKCAGRNKTNEEVIEELREARGDFYDYTQLEYTGANDPLKIICPKHGEFFQTLHNHKKGAGCSSCRPGKSKPEDEIAEYLESLGLEIQRNRRDVISPYELDIYVPSLQLAIEHCGLYWHSEAKGKTNNYHLQKHNLCLDKGIRLLTIFEDEWRDKQDILKASLQHFAGKSPKGCPGRKATIREITWREAKPFLEKHHMLGAGRAGRHTIGAYDPDDNLIAVMVWGIPSNEQGKTAEMEMTRYVCTKANHPGLASKMFRWSVREYGFEEVIAFVDLRFFEGAFKQIAGFEKVSQSQPTLFWTNGIDRKKRRFETKRTLLKRPEFIGRNMTKKDMLKELGYYRIWDCGKSKFVWSSDK